MNYKAAHYRLARMRGRASEYRCLDCGGPAREWSYRGGCFAELVDAKSGRPFSPNPEDYDPRCNGCHQRHDADRRPYKAAHALRMSEIARVVNLGNQHTKGRVMPEHEKARRSAANKGRPKSEEHKEKIRQAALRRWAREKAAQ